MPRRRQLTIPCFHTTTSGIIVISFCGAWTPVFSSLHAIADVGLPCLPPSRELADKEDATDPEFSIRTLRGRAGVVPIVSLESVGGLPPVAKG